ncbi:MAG TPA: OsmC family protein [Vicinamibacterales bacterium]
MAFHLPIRRALTITAVFGLVPFLAGADESLPLGNYLTRLAAALQRQGAAAPQALRARVTAESRSGVRRLRIRDFQLISDSQRSLAGYNLGAGSWDTQVGVLGSAVANEFLFQAAAAGITLERVEVVFTSHQDDAPLPPGKVAYPRNLAYTAYIASPASDGELEDLRAKVEATSPVLAFVTQPQDIPHGRVVYTKSPATPAPDSPPGLRDFLVEKRAALLRRAEGDGGSRRSPPLRAHVRVEGGTGLRHVRTGEFRFQFIHDNPRELAGFDLGPSAEEHQLGVMGTCLTHIFEIQAAQRQIALDALEIEVEGTLTPRRPGGAPPRLRDVRYTVRIASPEPPEKIDALRAAVEAVCPIYNLLKDPQTIEGRVVRGRFPGWSAEDTSASR